MVAKSGARTKRSKTLSKVKTTKRPKRTTTKRVAKTNQPNWDARYGDPKIYRQTCAIAHRSTGNKCCCCLKAKSQEIHHTEYGRDSVGKTIFPLCKGCHSKMAHAESNWVKDKSDPVWKSHNTPAFVKRLRLGYQLLSQGCIKKSI